MGKVTDYVYVDFEAPKDFDVLERIRGPGGWSGMGGAGYTWGRHVAVSRLEGAAKPYYALNLCVCF